MKLESVQIKNFRMLQDFEMDVEDILTLVIGKNNSGKTSFLSILQTFLSGNEPEFAFEDFNIQAQKDILGCEGTSKSPEEYLELALSLKLYISYNDADSLRDVADLILDLDETKQHLVILFEYVLTYEKYQKLVSDYNEYKSKGINRSFEYFVSNHIKKYFSVRIRALEYENETNSKIISKDTVKSAISMQVIGAKRDVDNEQGRSHSLSLLAGKYYSASVLSEEEFPDLQKQLQKTDENLSKIYETLFKDVTEEIARMSYNPREAELAIISTLSEKKIFQENTTVKYKHNDTLLPEDYNGLGYLNLFAIIFNLRIKLDQLSKKNQPDKTPTPLNLLFIEEPEAHTHPQMQYVFITNIKRLLKEHCAKAGDGFSLQTILSTHSSHIVSQCDFQDIKYFYRNSSTSGSSVSVSSHSLKNLYSKMVRATDSAKKEEEERLYRFVKQYITLNRAELFFADKAILIEGDTERMLLSAMMKKYDAEHSATLGYEPLMSQNISVIEVGAYAHVFATFLGFLRIKTLIITDLDCAKVGENGHLVKCRFSDKEATTTTNSSIKYFTRCKKLSELVELAKTPIILDYDDTTSTWMPDTEGHLKLIFQKEENEYQARSFEDAFIAVNLHFIQKNKDLFESLKNRKKLEDNPTDYYAIADECVDSKTSFALDILLCGGSEKEEWSIPCYIKEGLEWLAQ